METSYGQLANAIKRAGAQIPLGDANRSAQSLLGRIQSGKASVDEQTAQELARLLDSVVLRYTNATVEARQNLKVTSRTIAQAMRRPLG